jgi:hypothetical protein
LGGGFGVLAGAVAGRAHDLIALGDDGADRYFAARRRRFCLFQRQGHEIRSFHALSGPD